MSRVLVILVVLWLAIAGVPGHAQDEDATPPVPIDKTERAEVRLVMLDTIVIDSNGDPVAGLEKQDFEIRHGGQIVAPDVLETRCEPDALQQQTAQRSDAPRRLILAFDYLHLPMFERESALESAMQMVKKNRTAGDEVMVAALTGGLRIEQPFTTDAAAVLGTLKRMQKDVSLWNGEFGHVNAFGFVRGMTALFDVLAAASAGPKAMVFYSAMQDVPMDYQFEHIAAIAAASRTAMYTVDPYGLFAPDISSRGGRPG
jgi:VWFA-related protein